MMKRVYLLAGMLLGLSCAASFATAPAESRAVNFSYFSAPQKEITEELLGRTPEALQQHPDFGTLPVSTPCKDCYEDLSQRSADTRMFYVKGSRGTHFYKQQSLGAINYKDASGYWREINPHLQSPSRAGEYHAPFQPNPVTIDINRRLTSITCNGKTLTFNKDLALYHLGSSGKLEPIGTPDWSQAFAGDEGVKILDIYPGIDLDILVYEGQVKANFVLNGQIAYHDGWLVMKQGLALGDDLRIDLAAVSRDGDGMLTGRLPVVDAAGNEFFRIGQSVVYDNNTDNNARLMAAARISGGNELLVYVPVSWLNRSDLVYPVTLDPLVSASQNMAQAAITGSGYSATCYANGCTYNLPAINVPASCTVTDVKTTFSYIASNLCTMKDGGIFINYGACRAPNAMAFFNPVAVAGNASINTSLYPYINTCIPAPQCASYAMNFILNFYRCNFDTASGCNSNCISAGSAWVVTVEGHTVDLSTITPSHIMCTGGSTSLSATASNGVGPYSYSWSPGGAGSPISVSPAGTQVYTCTATDACGSTATNNCTVTVTGSAPASVTITPNGTVCAGSNITFTAIPNNGGSAPAYTWYIGAAPVQIGGSTFTTTVNSNDSISVQMTSNSACAAPALASYGFSIANTVSSSVALTTNPNTPPYCIGTTVTLTATPTNGGPNPVYGWAIGTNVFLWTTNNTFAYTVLTGGKTFRVYLVSDLPCVTTDTVPSATKTISGTAPIPTSVTVSPNPASACTGDPILFTASAVGGGATPTYQWYVNNVLVPGQTAQTFNATTLVNGDSVSVTMTSSANCASPATAASVNVPVTMNPVSPATVSIAPDPPPAICAGQSIAFTATPGNGGTTPTYQWYVNNVAVPGETASTFNTTALTAPSSIVKVWLFSNSACAIPDSAVDSVSVPVSAAVPTTIAITGIVPATPCPGQNVTFSTNGNGGPPLTYQWQVNGVNVPGATSGTFTQSFAASATVSVILNSGAACAVPAADTATVTITPASPTVPVVTLSAAPPGTICSGTLVNFTATPDPTSAVSSPTYQWFRNGTAAGTGTTYSNSSLANGDIIKVVMTPSGCFSPATDTDQVTMTVIQSLAPAVTLAQTPAAPCPGASLTFSAHTTNGGAAPTFQWWVNGNPVAVPDSVFTSGTLSAGDVVKVTLHSSVPCPTPNDSVSVTLNAVFSPAVTPSVSINPVASFCLGTSVTFTAVPVNGGTTPTFQWQVNNVNIPGATASTYTTSSLAIGDSVTVILTSNANCASPVTVSATYYPIVTPNLIPGVSLSGPPGDSVCVNANAAFTALPDSNQGAAPTYQWLVNGTAAGTGPSFNTTTLTNGAVVSVVMTSSDPCAFPLTDTARVTMTVKPSVVPAVTLSVSPNDSVCQGDPVTFSTAVVNEGPSPQYQWLNNGTVIAGQTGTTYSSSSLTNGAVISVILISDANCAVPASDTDQVAMTVSITVPAVTVAAAPSGSICAGDNVTFTATPVNGGTTPVYQWYEGGNPVGTNSATYATTTLTNGIQVTVTMTSSAYCAIPQQANSAAFTANVVQYQTPAVSITSNPSGTICVGNPVTFTATPVFGGTAPVYQWHVNGVNAGTNSATFVSSTLVDGDVVDVTLTSNYQCLNTPTAASNQIIIDAADPLTVTISGGTNSVCPGEPVTLSATASGGVTPYAYSWNHGGGSNTQITINPLVTTTYAVAVSDVCGSAIARDSVTVNVYPSPAADFSYSPQNPSTLAPQVTFTDLSNQAINWLWDFGDSTTGADPNPVHIYDGSGYFHVQLTVQNAFGCLDSVDATILIKDEVAMYIPNSFTPDGDGNNDFFGPVGYNLGPFQMLIYDRWGQKVFEGDESTPWDGRKLNNKEMVPIGVYVYRIYFDDPKYTEPVVVGRITVAR